MKFTKSAALQGFGCLCLLLAAGCATSPIRTVPLNQFDPTSGYRFENLEPGDLIFSGTPAGVGPVKPGDELEARVEGVGELKVKIVPAL